MHIHDLVSEFGCVYLTTKRSSCQAAFFVLFVNYLDNSSIIALAIARAICGSAAIKQP